MTNSNISEYPPRTHKLFFYLVYPRHGQPRLNFAQSSTLKQMTIKIGLCRSAVESILLYGLECLPLTLTLHDKLESAYRRILRYALRIHFPDCISNAELTRRTGSTALSKTLCQRRLRLVRHALRMANPSPLMILLRFLQPGLWRRHGQARTLTLHQEIIDNISAINQSVKSMTSVSKSYFNRIVATLNTT